MGGIAPAEIEICKSPGRYEVVVELNCAEQATLSFAILPICLGFEAQPNPNIGVRWAAEQRPVQNGPGILTADRCQVGQPEPNGGVRGGQRSGPASVNK